MSVGLILHDPSEETTSPQIENSKKLLHFRADDPSRPVSEPQMSGSSGV